MLHFVLATSPATGRRQSGYTLLEILVATGIATLVTLAGLSLTKVGADSATMIASTQRSDSEIERALRLASDRVKSASASATQIVAGTSHDVLTLQVVAPTDFSDTPEVGYWDTANQFQTNWSCDFLVVGTDLVHRVRNAVGTVVHDTTICTNVKARTVAGVVTEKAFSVATADDLVTLSIRVESELSGSKLIERQETTSIRQLNP
ncbi:MAG: type II secretion system protein J [Planctomycetota bacterium]